MKTNPKSFRKNRNICGPFSLADFKKRGLLNLLAYETGVHLGDGSLGYYYDKYTKQYQYHLHYTGGFVNEYDYYKNVVLPIFERLYGIKKGLTIKNRDNTCNFYTKAKNICLFKKDIGLPIGKKVNVTIPPFINTKELKAHFLRGFADTDFSLTFKNLKKIDYPTIKCSISDKKLLGQLYKICLDLNLQPYAIYDVVRNDKRYNKDSIIHNLYLHGKPNLNVWMKLVGFWSSKHLTKFLLWERTGKGSKFTTTSERYEILKRLGVNVSINPLPR